MPAYVVLPQPSAPRMASLKSAWSVAVPIAPEIIEEAPTEHYGRTGKRPGTRTGTEGRHRTLSPFASGKRASNTSSAPGSRSRRLKPTIVT